MIVSLALAVLANTVVLERGAILPGYGRYQAVEDTVLDNREGDLWQGGSSALIVGANRPMLIQFLDLQRAVGRNKRVTKATLELVFTKGTPKLATARRMLVPWTEGPIATVAGQLRGDERTVRWAATYRMRRNGIDAIPWQAEGGRGDAESELIAGVQGTLTKDSIVISGLESAVQAQLDRWYDNHGFAFEFESDNDFLSSSASEGRPRLTLELEDRPRAAGPDLSVTLIRRTPEYDRYDSRDASTIAPFDGADVAVMDKVKNATAKKWPDEGEPVLYTAVVKNVGSVPASAFEAQWLDREAPHSLVKVDKALAPGEEATITLELPFRGSHSDHRVQPLALRIFPKGDADKSNDFLQIHQGALSFEFVVPPSLAEALAKEGWAVEDWVQAQVRRWNDVTSRYSRYSFAPDGALERIRAQKISVGSEPPPLDLKLDGQVVIQSPGQFESLVADALGLVALTTPLSGGATADGTKVPWLGDPFPGLTLGGETRSDAMLIPTLSFPYDTFSDLIHDPDRLEPVGPLSMTDVYALNRNLGRRRGYVGDYLYDVPGNVLLTLTDLAGRRLADTAVTFYQMKRGTFEGVGSAFSLRSNASGLVPLPKRDPGMTPGFFTATGHALAANPFGRIDSQMKNGMFLAKVDVQGVTGTAVLKAWQVVDAAARARSSVAMINLRFNVPSGPLSAPPSPVVVTGPDGPLPALSDGNAGTAVAPPSWIDVDLGQEVSIGEIALSIHKADRPEWTYDILVRGASEKPEGGRPYVKERNFAWSFARYGEDGKVPYRGMPQRARFIRILSRTPAKGVELSEIAVRVLK